MNNSDSARPWAPSALSALAANRSVAQEHPEAKDARALWHVIAAIIVVDALWAWSLGIRISVPIAPLDLWLLFLFVGVSLVYSTVRPNRRIAALVTALLQLTAFAVAAILLSYMAAASNFPLVDRYLAAADAAIGFDWLSLFNWMRDHPAINFGLRLCYMSLPVQIFALVIVLNFIGKLERTREFVWLYVLTLLIIIPLSLVMPAEGAWAYYGLSPSAYYLPDFYAIRAGAMPVIDLPKATGIVQFPSFHAALGLIFIFSSRGIRILFPISVGLNLGMIASTLTHGGHHLADLISGLAVVPVAMLILRTRRRDQAP